MCTKGIDAATVDLTQVDKDLNNKLLQDPKYGREVSSVNDGDYGRDDNDDDDDGEGDVYATHLPVNGSISC
tara:strand:- start:341 stop:553 length:213 start_codon:yes stop_codon:yes gene_type:complete